MEIENIFDCKIAVIGLGYVGLPLAIELSKKFNVIAYDISEDRVSELRDGYDRTRETEREELLKSRINKITTSTEDLKDAQIFIVAVPTPIDASKQPNLNPLRRATETIGKILKKNTLVIYESTVYPGATEEFCVPILASESGLKYNEDFFCGYSPERINPGDKKRRLTNIIKITSGSTPKVAKIVDQIYSSIVTAGTHMAPSIRTAEAAKIIENTQRDLNIALINELSIIFDKMKLNTNDVLEAALTKWNFMDFRPGLVGGHCIGVDPYYLTYKSELLGYYPQLVLAGRRINDGMAQHVSEKLILKMIERGIKINHSSILILGLTFKENCPDTRNSKVIDVIHRLESLNARIDVYDPLVEINDPLIKSKQIFRKLPEGRKYDAVIAAVAHNEFSEIQEDDLKKIMKPVNVIFDLKNILPKLCVDMVL